MDLGCRDGALSRFYREGNEIIGVDIDREALRICQEQFGIETFWLDLNDPFPFEACSFDVVIAGEVIEHLYYPELFLEEVAKVLKPEGQLIGSTCNAFRLRNRWKFLLGKEYEDKTHLHRFSFKGIEQLMVGYFREVLLLPFGGHLLGDGRWGIKVGPRTLRRIAKLFALDIVWHAQGVRKGKGAEALWPHKVGVRKAG